MNHCTDADFIAMSSAQNVAKNVTKSVIVFAHNVALKTEENAMNP